MNEILRHPPLAVLVRRISWRTAPTVAVQANGFIAAINAIRQCALLPSRDRILQFVASVLLKARCASPTGRWARAFTQRRASSQVIERLHGVAAVMFHPAGGSCSSVFSQALTHAPLEGPGAEDDAAEKPVRPRRSLLC